MNCFSQLAFIGPGGPEFLVVMLVLLLMFGAKDAPRIFRKINEIFNSIRNTADSFKREVMYSDIDASRPPYEEVDEVNHVDDDGIGLEPYDEEHEADYSDDTFMGLEDELVSEESALEEEDVGEDDAQKA